MAKGSTTKVSAPTTKISSVKIPNAAKAMKPIVSSKMAKMPKIPNQKLYNPAAGFKVAKTSFPNLTKGM